MYVNIDLVWTYGFSLQLQVLGCQRAVELLRPLADVFCLRLTAKNYKYL